MKHFFGILLLILLIGFNHVDATFSAGAAKAELVVPDGTPLAAYNHGARSVPNWPLPEFRVYSTFLNPHEGQWSPCFAKALVLDDGQGERVCFVTLDLMSADDSLGVLAHAFAAAQGFSVPIEKVTFSGSHTHSSYGAYTPATAMAITPTTDFFVPKVQQMMAQAIAKSMIEAEKTMVPANVGFGSTLLTNITRNRRAKESPYVNTTSIDPHFTVLSVDDLSSGRSIATLFNFAIHGTCFGASNMKASPDIMGEASAKIEELGGGLGLFVNADAGDVSPCCGACDNAPHFKGGVTMANTAMQVRSQIKASSTGRIQAAAKVVNFGQTITNLTLSRNTNINCTLTDHGPYQICVWCKLFDCTINIPFGQGWIEQTPRFNAIGIEINNKRALFTSMPVEAIVEVGDRMRAESAQLGFDETFFMGYTNSYLMYLTTPREYVLGGYEALLTLWGIHESDYMVGNATEVAKKVQF